MIMVKRLLIAIALLLSTIGHAQVIQTFAALAASNIFTANLNTFEGILATNITDSALTAGNCVQASTGGLLITSANPCGSGSGTVTSIAPGTGLSSSPNPITTTGTISLANTAVTPASYTLGSFTVNQQGQLTAASSGILPHSCQSGLGDGFNTMAADTYTQVFCYNDTGQTWTLTGFKCFTDNSGASTMNAIDNSSNALLTGAIACSTSYASGTQSVHTTIPAGGWIVLTFIADGTSRDWSYVVSGTIP